MNKVPLLVMLFALISLGGCTSVAPKVTSAQAPAIELAIPGLTADAEVRKWEQCVEKVNAGREQYGYKSSYPPIKTVAYGTSPNVSRGSTSTVGSGVGRFAKKMAGSVFLPIGAVMTYSDLKKGESNLNARKTAIRETSAATMAARHAVQTCYHKR